VREFLEIDGEAEHHEGDDLAEAGQRGVEVSDLAFVGRPGVIAERGDREGGGSEPGLTDAHATVEQDAQQADRDQLLHDAFGRAVQVGHDLDDDRRGDQDHCRGR
jgi:hypothetical protein